MLKKCTHCQKEKELDCFFKSKAGKYGVVSICKECYYAKEHSHEKECETCGKKFLGTKKQRFCSKTCKPQCSKVRYYVDCSYCGKKNIKQLTASRIKNSKDFYCNDDCKNKHHSILYSGENNHNFNSITCICVECGKSFLRTPSQIKKHGGKYCSKECALKNYSAMFSGSNNPNYNPNKSDEERIVNRNIEGYNEWQRLVFQRDNYSCQCCGDDKGGNLNAHHILNYSKYPELRTDINNGITLCKPCHKLFHDTYGYKNNNQEQLNDFLKNFNMVIPSQASEKSDEGVETNRVI